MRKKALAVVGVVAALFVLAALVFVIGFDANRYRAQAQTLIASRLGRAVTLGQLHLSLVPFGIRVENVEIAEDPGVRTGRPFAHANELYLSLRPLPLLRRRVEVQAFELRQPSIELVHKPDGRWNFSTLGGSSTSGSGQTALVLDRLTITGAQIAVTDGGSRTVYSDIDLQVDNVAPGRAFGVVLATPLPGKGAPRLTLRGTAGPLAQDDFSTTPFDGTVGLDDVDVGAVLNAAREWHVAAAEGVSGTGRVTMNVSAKGAVGALQYNGKATLSGAALNVPSLTQPLRVSTAELAFTGDTATLTRLAFSIGKTKAEGTLSLRNFTAPRVEFQLSADAIDVAEMQSLLTPVAQTSARPAQAGAAADQSFLMLATGTGRMTVGTITNEQLVLEKVQAAATLDHGRIRLNPLTADVFGGQFRGSVVVDARRVPATFEITSELAKVDANRLTSAVTNLRDVIFGALASSARVSASMGGADALPRSLNGTLSLDVADGRIGHMNLVGELGSIAKFVTARAGAQRDTPVKALTGHFTVTNGLAETDDLQATLEEGTLSAAGSINLVDQRVNLRLTAVLTRDYSQRVGGTRIGGYMNTALSNQEGELIVPVLMTGTMQEPRFAPDVKRLAEMKVRSLVPNLRAPVDNIRDRLRRVF